MTAGTLKTATPRVAVVIPCYNDGATVRLALESASNQEPCEVVVVNDGSSDTETLGILEAIGREHVKVIHQNNCGLGAARMAGVGATTARYVFPLDADDFLLPHSLTVLADHLDAFPDVGLCWGRYQFVGEKTHEHAVAATLDPWLVTYCNDMPVGAMVRRRTLAATGGWQLSDGYEDWDLWMACAESGIRGEGLDALVYCQRLHGKRLRRRCVPRHSSLYTILQARHSALFLERRGNRRASRAPLAAKVLVPAIYGLWPLRLHFRMTLAGYAWRALNGNVAPLAALRRSPYYAGETRTRRSGVRS